MPVLVERESFDANEFSDFDGLVIVSVVKLKEQNHSVELSMNLTKTI